MDNVTKKVCIEKLEYVIDRLKEENKTVGESKKKVTVDEWLDMYTDSFGCGP